MNTKSLFRATSLISILCAGAAYAADSEMVLSSSQDGMRWSNASLWTTGGVPGASNTSMINIGDSVNPLSVDGAYSVGNLTLNGNTWLLLDGAGNSLTTTLVATPFGDVNIYNNAKVEIKNGAALSVASGMSVRVQGNSSFLVDNATFSGGFYDNITGSVVFQNGATWNASRYAGGTVNTADILVDASTVNLVGNFQMGRGEVDSNSKVLTLQNGSKMLGTGTQSADFAGVVNILDSSSVSGLAHWNLGAGNSVGSTTVTLRGTDASNIASISAARGWINSGAGSSNSIILDGFSSMSLGDINSNNAFTGGDVSVLFKNSNNTFTVSGYNGGAVSWGDNAKQSAASGAWLLKADAASSNNKFTSGNFNINAAELEGSTFSAGVDWAGESTNVFTTSQLTLSTSRAANADTKTFFTLRGSAQLVNNGNLNIGTAAGLSGSATFTLAEGANLSYEKNTYMYMSAGTSSTASANLVIDGSTMTTTGEIFMAHSSANSAVASGNATIELKGDGAYFESVNKGLYSGYNSQVNGGSQNILMSGTNGKMKWGVDGTKTEIFYINGSSAMAQTGGTFDLRITGSGNEFYSNNIVMGKTGSTGGVNTIYMKSDSASKVNKIIFVNSAVLNVMASTATLSEGQTGIQNSVIMAGNSAMGFQKTSVPVIQIASDTAYKSGLASFIMTGKNNKLEAWRLNVGNTGSTSANGVLRIEGSGQDITVFSSFNLSGNSAATKDNALGGKIEFIADSEGFSAIKLTDNSSLIENPSAAVNAVIGDLSGVIFVDFTQLEAAYDNYEFTLISAQYDWKNVFDAWYAKGLFDYKLRDSSDTVDLIFKDNTLVLVYTSTVPEPATYAAIFGLLALAFAIYRRKTK